MGDGAAGPWALKRCGGISVVQDLNDALHAEMPLTALNRAQPDYAVKLADLPALFDRLVREPAGPPTPAPDALRLEADIARSARSSVRGLDRIGRRAVLTCPDCNGVMWEIDDGDLVRYRCHLGHACTADVMALALDDRLRRALASSLRAPEERAALARKLEEQSRQGGRRSAADSWARKAEETDGEAEVIRESLRRLDRAAAEAEKRRAVR